MEVFHDALLLLLVLLSPISVHVKGESDYKCTGTQRNSVTVTAASAQMIEGCLQKGNGITFDIGAMYGATALKSTKPSNVVIDITEAAFVDSYIKLINADSIPGDINTQVPLLFTMCKAKLIGTSKLVFGSQGKPFKFPPHSFIRIISSHMIITTTDANPYVFTFHSLQLVTRSSIKISDNVITMECDGCATMTVFYVPKCIGILVSDESSFTLLHNAITITGHGSSRLIQHVWYAYDTLLTISEGSAYTCESNNISMVGYDVTSDLQQYVLFHSSNSPLSISENSKYTWSMNSISILGYNVKEISQYVYYILSYFFVSAVSQILFNSNRILLLARDYSTASDTWSYVMATYGGTTISKGSSGIWRDNCIGMGHKEADRRHVFKGGNVAITEGSDALGEGFYITTTDRYERRGIGLTELLRDFSGRMLVTINTNSKLIFRNTKVHSNIATDGVTSSVVWNSTSFASSVNVKEPAVKWSSSAAKDSNGSPIPTLDISNIEQYMCTALPTILQIYEPVSPTTEATTIPAKSTSATAISSTIPDVLITSVAFLYLYYWQGNDDTNSDRE